MIITIKRHPHGFSPYYPRNPKTLGDQIRKKRLDLGLTTKQVAEQLDIHFQTIINYEKRGVKPKGERLAKVMGFLEN